MYNDQFKIIKALGNIRDEVANIIQIHHLNTAERVKELVYQVLCVKGSLALIDEFGVRSDRKCFYIMIAKDNHKLPFSMYLSHSQFMDVNTKTNEEDYPVSVEETEVNVTEAPKQIIITPPLSEVETDYDRAMKFII